jgi:hypothetical protein
VTWGRLFPVIVLFPPAILVGGITGLAADGATAADVVATIVGLALTVALVMYAGRPVRAHRD